MECGKLKKPKLPRESVLDFLQMINACIVRTFE